MIDESRIENLYNVIRLDEEVNQEEIKNKAKENIVAIYLSMDQLRYTDSYKMQQRVSEVKEYITILEKQIESKKRVITSQKEHIKNLKEYIKELGGEI